MIRSFAQTLPSASATSPSCASVATTSRPARGFTSRITFRGSALVTHAVCAIPTRTQRTRRTLDVRAERIERETRLGSVLTSLPQRFNLYFARKSYRTTLWRGISAWFGFYLANVLTLSFGAIGINDVVAGALSVAFFEIITRIYYRTASPNRWLEFINWFKIGYCYSLTADAFKLGS